MNKKYFISYICDGINIVSNDLENDHYSLEISEADGRYTVILNPKCKIEMVDFYVEFPYEFKSNDLFFGAGYQSWTYTKEYNKNDVMKGTIKLSHINSYLKHYASITGDDRIVSYSERLMFSSSKNFLYIVEKSAFLIFACI